VLLPAFRNVKKFLKGNLHSHTTVSDGPLSPKELVDAYHKKGYDFLVLTDHRKVVKDAPSLSTKGMVVIRGAELHPDNHYGGSLYHFVAVDIPGDYDTSGKHGQEVIDDIVAQGALVYLAHPSWSGHGRTDLFPLHGYHGVEVANYGCREVGRMLSEDEWDDINTWQNVTDGIAVDDGHRMNDIGGAWVMVNAKACTAKAIKQALAEGRFYSSTGPEIYSVRVEPVEIPSREAPILGTKVSVKTSPARRVCLRSVPTHGSFVEGSDITAAEMTVKRRDVFYRVVVEDSQGQLAWSNPFIPARLFGGTR